jgi:hypothetical protein
VRAQHRGGQAGSTSDSRQRSQRGHNHLAAPTGDRCCHRQHAPHNPRAWRERLHRLTAAPRCRWHCRPCECTAACVHAPPAATQPACQRAALQQQHPRTLLAATVTSLRCCTLAARETCTGATLRVPVAPAWRIQRCCSNAIPALSPDHFAGCHLARLRRVGGRARRVIGWYVCQAYKCAACLCCGPLCTSHSWPNSPHV